MYFGIAIAGIEAKRINMISSLTKYFKKLTTPLIVVILTKSCHLMADPSGGGGLDGGGGRSVVCRNKKGKIKSAELFDFYEGRVQHKVKPVISKDSFESQVETMIQRIGKGREPQFTENLRLYANFIIGLIKSNQMLPDGTGLIPVEDSKHEILPPKNCEYEQLANYTSQNQVLINREIWKKLNNTNKAGLVVHEALYKVFRFYGATNSKRVRKVVAFTFSGIETYPPVFQTFSEKPLKCHTLLNENGSPFPGTSFYAYNTPDGDLHFQFDYIDGGLMLSKTIIGIDKIPIEKLLGDNEIPFVTYWIPLSSLYDFGSTIVISFEPRDLNNNDHRKKMKIGIQSIPAVPTQEFLCGPSDSEKTN